jgi:hypothetical protein
MLTIAHLNESAPAELNLTPIAVDVETAAKLILDPPMGCGLGSAR